MSLETSFERLWSDVESGVREASEVGAHPSAGQGLAGLVMAADALRRFGETVPEADLDSTWAGLAAELAAEAPSLAGSQRVRARERGPVSAPVRTPAPLRWRLGVAAGIAAALVVLASVSLRSGPGSFLYPVRVSLENASLALSPSDGGLHLRIAQARLDDLLVALEAGPVEEAPELAGQLVSSRAAAVEAGRDVSDLDLRVALEVPPALATTPEAIALRVRGILGHLLPPDAALSSASSTAPDGVDPALEVGSDPSLTPEEGSTSTDGDRDPDSPDDAQSGPGGDRESELGDEPSDEVDSPGSDEDSEEGDDGGSGSDDDEGSDSDGSEGEDGEEAPGEGSDGDDDPDPEDGSDMQDDSDDSDLTALGEPDEPTAD